MAPTEAQILESYLLRPAGLEAIVTYEWFAERFPSGQRDNPQVRLLWQDAIQMGSADNAWLKEVTHTP